MSHYDMHPSGIEAIEITRYESFLRGNIIKYIMRAPYKYDELDDLKKAAQYLQWEIERVEQERSDFIEFDDLVWPESCQECDGACKVCGG